MDFEKSMQLMEDVKSAFSKIILYKNLWNEDSLIKYAKLFTNDITISKELVLECMMKIKNFFLELDNSFMNYEYLLENIYELSMVFGDITTDLSFVSGVIHLECRQYIEYSEFFDDHDNYISNSTDDLTINEKKMIELVIFEWNLDFINDYCFKLNDLLENMKNIKHEKMITILYYHYRKQDSIKLCKRIKDELFEITYEYDYMMKHILNEDEKNKLKMNFKTF